MKKLYILFLFVFLFSSAYTQDRNFDLYPNNLKAVNPAFTGLNNEQNYDVQYNTWTNFSRDVSKMLVSYSNRIDKINSGLGFIFYEDKGGIISRSSATLLYNYQFKLSTKSKLSVGIGLRYNKMSASYEYIFNSGVDPALLTKPPSSNIDLDLGVLYKVNNLSVSLSTKGLLQSELSGWSHYRIYNFYIANDFIVNKWLKVTPSVLYNTDFHSRNYSSIDFNAQIELKKLILLGFTQRVYEDGARGIYSAGINIKDKVKIVGMVYSKFYHSDLRTPILDLMVGIKIKNEEKQ